MSVGNEALLITVTQAQTDGSFGSTCVSIITAAVGSKSGKSCSSYESFP